MTENTETRESPTLGTVIGGIVMATVMYAVMGWVVVKFIKWCWVS
jgi:hypothetical protein